MEHIVKLNARGQLMMVDEAILAKSSFFRHLLNGDGFKETLPNDKGEYYVDCDHDVLVELVAYMETGYFKYKTINGLYLKHMLNKYGIKNEHPVFDKNKSIELYDKISSYIANTSSLNFEKTLNIRFIEWDTKNIEFEIDADMVTRYSSAITLICKYNESVYPITTSSLEKHQRSFYACLTKYKLNNIVIDGFSGYKGIIIKLKKLHKVKDNTEDENEM